jgi:37-kD nucleoid-associated bacterial protein
MIDLQLLTIERLVIHHINPRAGDKSYIAPTYGTQLVALPPSGLDMFTKRIAQALGHHSHGIQAQFDKTGPGTFFMDAVDLMDGNDELFFATSKTVADSLAKAQQSKSLAPSKLLIVSGHTSKKQQPFSAVVKAELQDALAEKKSAQGKTVVDYLTEIFFAESQKLYKIGFIQKTNALGGKQAPNHFSIHLFDHLMTGTETRDAAYYFYKEFLGANISDSDRQLTKQFFDKTIDFLNSLDISPAKRIDLNESLRAELRSNDQTISVKSFGAKHLDAALQPKYAGFMDKVNFPTNAITKDTEFVKARLKRRHKIVFTSGVMITTPADKAKLVAIHKSIDGATQVTISGSVESQE